MPKTSCLPLRGVAALLATLAFALTSVPASGAATASSLTAQSCTGKNLETDVQINQCLDRAILRLNTQMSSAVAVESKYLGAHSKGQDLRLEEVAQSAFLKYARNECTAQINPYATGTIAPIFYGECIISLSRQRLALLRNEIAYFKNGGEASNAS
ncbi:MAG: lysozyme inhibitor LprI family protein [Acidimicrobiales bacterium]